ncbi:hypothetical protein [Photobacterium sp. TY1-4]|uniref:hypothetical protein n=1 Tax=Photobacterium sp. TY1-4 TaxID=2899122 RepID=UPI0021C1C370|nr:hypothetical protein [Photobacterium sp. TY1-4]UXI03594.1 hypothetical protein NH461_24560 [Photobacterium sp. TY1-4]
MHDFIGRWKITSMSNWSQEYVDLVEPGYFEFSNDGLGQFVFGAVKGWMDVRVSTRFPVLEFSWQGICEGDELCGRGKIEFDHPLKGDGTIFIHCSDESGFTIERVAK